jgi:RHS repeat-associated protein
MIKNGHGYQLVTDHLGSVRIVVDVSSGDVVQKLEYDEYGNIISDSNPDFQPFGYAGGLYDSQTKLVRFGARDYDASAGRWTCKDLIGFEGRVSNIYEYCINDPINNKDESGLQYLKFNGRTVKYYDENNNLVGTYTASSGRNNVTSTGEKDNGPIPEGLYFIDPQDISKGGWLRNLTGDWGEYRAPLQPAYNTDVKGRKGFFLHGGKKLGSRGCIDVGEADKYLFPILMKYNQPIPVWVKYPPSGPPPIP